MQILVLGGTRFLGRHIVEAAISKGHKVTLFHRGMTNANLFADIEHLCGDRDGELGALNGRRWDAVIDTSGYLPRVVRQSAELLEDAVGQYVFISSISVYTDFLHVGLDESYPVGKLEDESTEDVERSYGPLKALCELEVQSKFLSRSLIIRPGLIVGPHDPTDRFTYWVRQFSHAREVLVPGRKERPIQFIDVRDLAQWIVDKVDSRLSGVFNATGPSETLTMQQFVGELETSVPNSAAPVWVSEGFLLEHAVTEWADLPLWISDQTNWPGFLTADVTKAVAEGLKFRPLRTTIEDTLTWDCTRSFPELKAGLGRTRELELLQSWKTR